MPKIPVAIACQGGGSHAAFTAGVLDALLGSAELWRDRELVALSGTSGGGVCASLVWTELRKRGSGDAGARQAARANLTGFWNTLGSPLNPDQVANWASVQFLVRNPLLPEFPPPPVSVYTLVRMRQLLEPRLEPGASLDDAVVGLYLGATDVLTGERAIFPGPLPLRVEHVIASAAVPPLFLALPLDGHFYWDGLFSANPPIRELARHEPKPKELWVIRLNPVQTASPPVFPSEIIDRRNELAGNLALDQELNFVETINAVVPAGGYAYIKVHDALTLDDPDLDYASKLDISPANIDGLMRRGRAAAARFMAETLQLAPAPVPV